MPRRGEATTTDDDIEEEKATLTAKVEHFNRECKRLLDEQEGLGLQEIIERKEELGELLAEIQRLENKLIRHEKKGPKPL